MTYEGGERRHMNQDQIDRDRLLSETHFYAKSVSEWAEKHDKKDDERFKEITVEVQKGKRFVWVGIGGFAMLEFILRIFK